MKKVINILLTMMLIIGSGSLMYGSEGNIAANLVELSFEKIDKQIFLLDQIVELAKNVVETSDDKSRKIAKEQLMILMESDNLDKEVKILIKGDIDIIVKTTRISKKISKTAYDSLVNLVEKIKAQAKIIAVAAEATNLVESAPENEKLSLIAYSIKKIQDVTQAARDAGSKVRTGVKSMAESLFNNETLKSKTLFYSIAGALALAIGGYKAYQYYVQRPLIDQFKEVYNNYLLIYDETNEAIKKYNNSWFLVRFFNYPFAHTAKVLCSEAEGLVDIKAIEAASAGVSQKELQNMMRILNEEHKTGQKN